MPEFILDQSGAVETGFAPDVPGMHGVTVWRDLSDVAGGYIQALFFTEQGDGNPGAGDGTGSGLWVEVEPGLWSSELGFSDLAPDALKAIVATCAAFVETPAYKAFEAWRDDDDSPDTSPANDEQVGHDLWLTRNGHGAGFWDRPDHYYGPHRDALDAAAKALGEVWPCVGDDGKVYL